MIVLSSNKVKYFVFKFILSPTIIVATISTNIWYATNEYKHHLSELHHQIESRSSIIKDDIEDDLKFLIGSINRISIRFENYMDLIDRLWISDTSSYLSDFDFLDSLEIYKNHSLYKFSGSKSHYDLENKKFDDDTRSEINENVMTGQSVFIRRIPSGEVYISYIQQVDIGGVYHIHAMYNLSGKLKRISQKHHRDGYFFDLSNKNGYLFKSGKDFKRFHIQTIAIGDDDWVIKTGIEDKIIVDTSYKFITYGILLSLLILFLLYEVSIIINKIITVENVTNNLDNIRQAVDSHSMMIIADKSGNIKYANDKYCETMMTRQVEVIGTSFAKYDKLHEKAYFFETVFDKALKGESVRAEIKVKVNMGKSIWVDASFVPIFNKDTNELEEIISIQTDISHRIAYQEMMDNVLAEKKASLSTIPGLLFEFDSKGNLVDTFSNGISKEQYDKRCSELVGFIKNPNDHLGAHVINIFTPHTASVILKLIKDAIKNENNTEMAIIDNRDIFDGLESFEITASRKSRQKGKDYSVIMLVNNITQRRINEQTLKKSRDEAAIANNSKSAFLAQMSHDLRTPLHGILSYAQLGEQRTGNPRFPAERIASYFSQIRISGDVLLKLLNSLLDLERYLNGKMPLNLVQGDIKKMSNLVYKEFIGLAMEKSISIIIKSNLADNSIFSDDEKICRVIRNLLSNAYKHSDNKSKIYINITDPYFGSSKEGGFIKFEVEDRGRGIPESDLKSIFDLYMQSSSTKPADGGTGLGLAICKEIILAHKGEIFAKNNSGNPGASVGFIVPRYQS